MAYSCSDFNNDVLAAMVSAGHISAAVANSENTEKAAKATTAAIKKLSADAAVFRKIDSHVVEVVTAVEVSDEIPADPEGQNDDRAEWAAFAIEAFRNKTGADREDAVSDLLTNLMHWCDRDGISFAAELRRACQHYKEETLA